MKKNRKYVELITGEEEYIKVRGRYYSFCNNNNKILYQVDGVYVAEGTGKYSFCQKEQLCTLFDGNVERTVISSLDKSEILKVIQVEGHGGIGIMKQFKDDFDRSLGFVGGFVIIIPKGTLKKGMFERKGVIFIPK